MSKMNRRVICLFVTSILGTTGIIVFYETLIDNRVNVKFTRLFKDRLKEKDKPLAERFRHRLGQTVCKSLPNKTFDKCEKHAVKGNLFNVSHDIVYCSVQKSGSTFWRRILKVIENGAKVKGPLKDTGLRSAYSLRSFKGVELY